VNRVDDADLTTEIDGSHRILDRETIKPY
jgi:hypothetical protein